jgi:ADP-ribose pyrophosphatase YjhB (NUDIX family)
VCERAGRETVAANVPVAAGISGDIPRHSVSVTAIVTRDDGRVLVIKRDDDGRWVPPGGVLELAETPQQACAREVLEETGYRVEVGLLTGVYKNMKLGVVSLAFRCALAGGEARTSEESAAVSWRTLEDVNGMYLKRGPCGCSMHGTHRACRCESTMVPSSSRAFPRGRFYSRTHRGWSRSRETSAGAGGPSAGVTPSVVRRVGSVRVSPSVVRRSGSVRACGWVGLWRAARDADRFVGSEPVLQPGAGT